MKTSALIQARMGSSRLPGKVLMELKEKPVLWHIINRLKQSVLINEIIVLTTTEKKDDEIEEFCIENKVSFYRGSERDVLERYYLAAKKFNVTEIVRITADCPLIDPKILDIVIKEYMAGRYDFYGVGSGFPNGINGAIFSIEALEESYIHAKTEDEHEHIGNYIKNNKEKFLIGFYDNQNLDLSNIRITLDTQDDYNQIKNIYDKLYTPDDLILLNDIIDYFDEESGNNK